MHGPSSRKRCFVLEGESEVLGVQAAAFRKGTSWDYGGTGNPTLLSWLSLVVVDWRKACQEGQLSNVGEEGRLSNVRGREGRSLDQGLMGA